jgi:hypothetical protein
VDIQEEIQIKDEEKLVEGCGLFLNFFPVQISVK